MPAFGVFLSVVLVTRNRSAQLEPTLRAMGADLSRSVSDYEIIVVDNASDDDSVAALEGLTGERGGLPNLQVFALTKEVDADTASFVGLESALGDFVAIIDPLADDIGFLPAMLEQALGGADVVFARNECRPGRGWMYRVAHWSFDRLYQHFNGIRLAQEAPHYRVLSKRVVNFILQHPQPALTYRHLPATGGFARVNLAYRWAPGSMGAFRMASSMDLGMRLIVSSTRAPLRWATWLSLFGAGANLVYSIYVLAVALFKADVAPGWTTLSLQQSGMFFLISLVLLILGEYILHMARLSNEGPPYHVSREFTSARMVRRERLNVEEPTAAAATQAGQHPGGTP